MTFDEHWARLVLINPGLGDPENKVTMPVPEMKRQLERAYQRGFQEGQEVIPSDDPVGALFEMFGNIRKDQT
jgi:hypothetical protein